MPDNVKNTNKSMINFKSNEVMKQMKQTTVLTIGQQTISIALMECNEILNKSYYCTHA